MPATIGVFDSGFGGLTVLRELLPLVGGSHCIYLGDTARLPYGSKSRETVVRYAVSSARFLHERGAEMLVIACNTASALALEDLREAMPIPVVGVIEPGTEAAVQACRNTPARRAGAAGPPEVMVLATQATVESHAYARACQARGLRGYEKACPLLVPLVEEGWTSDSSDARDSVTLQVLRIYLEEAFAEASNTRALLLGCTHYPLLRPGIEQTVAQMGYAVPVIDSADATARTVAQMLANQTVATGAATCEFFATDSIAKFARLGSRFLGLPIDRVDLVDLGG